MNELFPGTDGGTPVLLGPTDESHVVMTWMTDQSGNSRPRVGLYRVLQTGLELLEYQDLWFGNIDHPFQNDTGILGLATFDGTDDPFVDPYTTRVAIIRSDAGENLLVDQYVLGNDVNTTYNQYTSFAVSQDGTQFCVWTPRSNVSEYFLWVYDIDTGTLLWDRDYGPYFSNFAAGGSDLVGFPEEDRVLVRRHYLESPDYSSLCLLGPDGLLDELQYQYGNYDYWVSYEGTLSWKGCGPRGVLHVSTYDGIDHWYRKAWVDNDVIYWGDIQILPVTDARFGSLNLWGVWGGQLCLLDEFDDLLYWINTDTGEIVASEPIQRPEDGWWFYENYKFPVAQAGYDWTVIFDDRYLYVFWRSTATAVAYPLRLAQRNDNLGTQQRHPRISTAGIGRESSPSSNRIWQGQRGTYQ